MTHPAKGLLVCLILLHCMYANLAREKRAIFSWLRGSEPEPDAIELGPSPSVLKIHKYNGVKIQPVSSAPVYVQSGTGNVPVELTPQNIQQLDLLNQVSAFLPDGEDLQNYDFTTLLPYVELIPDDSLERIQFYVESKTSNRNSKLLAVINYLKAAKERKLKQAQHVINVGANLVNKKKKAAENALWNLKHHFSSHGTTSTSVPVIPSVPAYPFPAPLPPNFNPFGPGGISHQTSANIPSLSVVASSPNVDNLHLFSHSSSVSQPSVFASELSNNQYFRLQKPQFSLSGDISDNMATYNLPSSLNLGEQQHNSKSFGDHYSQPPVHQTFVQRDEFFDQPTYSPQSQTSNALISNSPLSTNHRLPLNDQFNQVHVQPYQYSQSDQSFNHQIHQLQNQNVDVQSPLISSSSQSVNHRAVLDDNQSSDNEFENKIASFNHRTQANTYLTNDLTSSASENVEQTKQQTPKILIKPSNAVDIVQPQTSLNFTTSTVTRLQGAVDGDVTRLYRIMSDKPPVHVTSSEVTDFEYSPDVSSTHAP